ncbi:MAG: hypothetical protein ACJAYU_003960 [Bradymonadia bacterium]|jgi:hypothetical protein
MTNANNAFWGEGHRVHDMGALILSLLVRHRLGLRLFGDEDSVLPGV